MVCGESWANGEDPGSSSLAPGPNKGSSVWWGEAAHCLAQCTGLLLTFEGEKRPCPVTSHHSCLGGGALLNPVVSLHYSRGSWYKMLTSRQLGVIRLIS